MTKKARHTSADTPAGGGAIAADVGTTDDGVSDGAVGLPAQEATTSAVVSTTTSWMGPLRSVRH